MKLIDAFPFFNELELLELRLAELSDVVDWFVIAEANKTHAGNPKSFVFEGQAARYRPFLDKVVYIKVTDLPDSSPADPWVAEHFQREALGRGLAQVARPGDRVLLSDVDEIPRRAAIAASLNGPALVVFHQQLYYYFVNCRVRRNWRGTVMVTYGAYGSLQRVRDVTRQRGGDVCQHGGWHYSYLVGCDPARLLYKAQNIVDSYNHYAIGGPEEVARKIMAHEDLYGRTGWRMKMRIADISIDRPAALPGWLERYPQFFYGAQPARADAGSPGSLLAGPGSIRMSGSCPLLRCPRWAYAARIVTQNGRPVKGAAGDA